MKDERTIEEAREAIRRAVAKIGLSNHEPEVDEAIDEFVAALLASSGKRQIHDASASHKAVEQAPNAIHAPP